MEKKWKNPQAYIVIAIIFFIFGYICVDAFMAKPQIKNELKEVKKEYTELHQMLDTKIPEIDSTFKLQASQIKEQKDQINLLEKAIGSK